MPPRKPGCLQCRKRHVRCDSVQPSCGTCEKASDGRQCAYVSLDIRPARYVERIGRQTLHSSASRTLISRSPVAASSPAAPNSHRSSDQRLLHVGSKRRLSSSAAINGLPPSRARNAGELATPESRQSVVSVKPMGKRAPSISRAMRASEFGETQ